ncbi:hypothetical protein NK8_82970 (plasmid) [Caballeronia sp. NK8]|uniref:cation:proton antiporter n=1 Tax=Caballeronia sp. NK8 TaxID=140098 RepID=UPI001BB7F7A7|nr:cation:proton antiporter [Caballeronia sp. NK8]BCQ30106.1 hypothetical protein NK8_82970 [Caballeronia sp. NK8]
MTKLLIDVVIFLASALITVPLAVRFGFGAVLGYLLAGVLIGPCGTCGFGDRCRMPIIHFCRAWGIVLMMFVIGLGNEIERVVGNGAGYHPSATGTIADDRCAAALLAFSCMLGAALAHCG